MRKEMAEMVREPGSRGGEAGGLSLGEGGGPVRGQEQEEMALRA